MEKFYFPARLLQANYWQLNFQAKDQIDKNCTL